MKEQPPNYSSYFDVGLRVEVRFPRTEDLAFRDWAVVTLFDEDLVAFQLSRDVLPELVKTDIGTILDLRLGKGGSAYCCRSIIVGERTGASITVRLIGGVVPDELREFYRIDAYIPLRYRIPTGESASEIKAHWESSRYGTPTASDSFPPPAVDAGESFGARADHPTPVAANISGSGIRIRTREQFSIGDLLPVELFLPLEPPRTISIVGQVVHVGQVRTREGDSPLFSTALHFYCIDERDQDAIIRFISMVQLEHLRSVRGDAISITDLEYTTYSRRMRRRRIIFATILISLILIALTLLAISRLTGPKGEIEQNYEREIQKYRSTFPWR
ncbi:PilZ-like domain-containing protein [Geobacter pickeringii]|uniref:Pilus assembly protein PilZ n=1 Tax=Geobacter pickeringii TaxID=345632 RepID=A0A0B5BAM3_9BACT|nr:PilZ-like domain-containing protein [Geobacter pickeringii]AJE03627.1 pilus assembly protein PilZ [Geobacter pickeringii]